MWRNGVACLGGLVILTASAGGGAGADKGRYSLFDPTPQRLMRDMTTDRPDTTESPFTVDAGHVQVESNVFGYARSRPDTEGDVTDTFDFAATNIRIGLTNDTEINVVWQPFGVTRTRQPGAAIQRESGVGGVDIRGKVNLWGNDTFDRVGSALALLPYLTLPTDAGQRDQPGARGRRDHRPPRTRAAARFRPRSQRWRDVDQERSDRRLPNRVPGLGGALT